MPTYKEAYIRWVTPNARFAERHEVAVTIPGFNPPHPLHTVDEPGNPLMATLCNRYRTIHKVVSITTTHTPFGERITGIEAAPEQQEGDAA